ncbi:VWA domain-containing protein [Fervidibacillus halotolerans]|uniref:VWA domain-containing protein n=1 Tax=Fervidibacillus halotolerans TaxID=2980027 RepID=A0A9E8M176_9BACI|nr:VWA domain-containing protein [Fervidibacillus halotolerans]WAA13628.1 VWA domain-containing protein [Fervidibacillus halotolerans]
MLEMKYPFMLILLIPILFSMYFFYKKHIGTNRSGKFVLVIFRGIIFILLVFALTIPGIRIPDKNVDVVFLIDRSNSVTGSEEETLSIVNEMIEKKGLEDRYAVLSFGNSPQLESPLRQRKEPFTFYSFDEKGDTNIEDGLYLASSLLKNGGRIVLITDGLETKGNAINAGQLLKDRGIEVDYMLVEGNEKEEMALSLFSLSESLYEGEQAVITVHVQSNTDGFAYLTIFKNGKKIIHEPVQVKRGENRFSFHDIVQETGLNVFKAELMTDQDTFIENNTLFAVTNVKGIPKILLVEDQPSPLSGILQQSGLHVDSLLPSMLPDTLRGYLSYESILFNNISATYVPEHRMNFIEQAVKEFGKGFVMLGGENSFGLGGYFQTPIERLLPVNMEITGKKQLPSLGLVIVLDRSSSMRGEKIMIAKEAAARSVELLREKDYFGFIVFDYKPHVIIETSPIENRDKTIEKIRSISSGGGTQFYDSLKLAVEQLETLDLQRKHIILLTDGEASIDGDYFSLIDRAKKSHITLSTVAIGTEANRLLLEKLAKEGEGRFYDVQNESVIPSILSRETSMMTRTYIVDDPFVPRVFPMDGWDRLFTETVPKMNAYIATTPKDLASIPIISDKDDPIISEWTYGLGRTVAFTSDVTGKWSGEFASWKDWSKFLNYIVSRSLPQYETTPFSFTIEKEGGEKFGRLKTGDRRLFQMEVSIVSDQGEKMDENVKLIGPNEYELDLPEESGLYYLQVKQTFEDGEVRTYQTGFSIPYSEEYLLLGTNEDLLQEIAKETGGSQISEETNVFRPLKKPLVNRTELSHSILLTVFFLLFFEFFYRRFGFSFLIDKIKERRNKEINVNRSHGKSIGTILEKTKERKQTEPSISKTPKGKNVEKIQDKSIEKGESLKSRGDNYTNDQQSREEKINRLIEAKKRKRL